MDIKFNVNVSVFGNEVFVNSFDTELEAARFIVNHKQETKDERLFTIEEVGQ